MLPVTEFTDHYSAEMISWAEGSEIAFSKDSLPETTQIVVLKPTLFRDE